MGNMDDLVREALDRYNELTPEEKQAHDKAQRESWVRGMMAKCEHGVRDFEQCPECRDRIRSAL